jgi:NADPH-dependent curcumin reductase CurA
VALPPPSVRLAWRTKTSAIGAKEGRPPPAQRPTVLGCMSCQAGNGEMRISHVQGFQLGSRCAGPNIASEILHPRSERSDRSGPEATLRGNSMTGNRQVWLKSRPNGIPQAENFDIRDSNVPSIAEGEFLVQNHYLSSDPAARGWITDASTYWPRIEIGDTMRAFAVGEVIDSRNPRYAVGEKLMGLFGWQEYAAASDRHVNLKIAPSDLPLSLYLGVLGLNGFTAYFGLLDVGSPRAGETVVVSTAAGAVGSCVGQIAKIKGCRTVGIAGGPQKVRQCVEEFGFDAAIDYKADDDLEEALRRACPEGVHVYFDNTSGSISDVVLRNLAIGARIVICGTASYPSWNPC